MKESVKQDVLKGLENLRDVVGNNLAAIGALNALVAIVNAEEVTVEKPEELVKPGLVEPEVENPVEEKVESKSEAEPVGDDVAPIEHKKKKKAHDAGESEQKQAEREGYA